MPNPIRTSISNNFPLIYDIATFISFQIGELWTEKVPEDETAFLALHVGAEIERQKHTPEKLRALLITSHYLQTNQIVRDYLQRNFSRDIVLTKEVEDPHDIASLESYDIVFSSLVPSETITLPLHTVAIDPFDMERQKADIQASIDRSYLWKKKQLVKDKFFSFFSSDLFWSVNHRVNKEEVFKPMIDTMLSNGVVNDRFYDEIMERESMGSTAFNKIAIPHPMGFSSPQTKVAVILDEDGIVWDSTTVNIVFIISISEQYKDEFRSIYENLMDFLSDARKFDTVVKSKTLYDFYVHLLSS